MADPVAGAAVPEAEAAAGAAQEEVLVRVQVSVLDEAMVDILDRRFDLDPLQAHGLELEHDQRTRTSCSSA